jgi:hypothetical protein
VSQMAYKDGWAHHRNAKESRAEQLSERLGEKGVVEVLSDLRYKAHQLGGAKAKAIRSAAEEMESAPGGQTSARNRGRHGASEKLSRKERKAADADLRKGRRR